jgi:hypothetical protein
MQLRLWFCSLCAITLRGFDGTKGHQSGTASNWAKSSKGKGTPRDNLSLASFAQIPSSNTQPLARPSTDLQTNGSYRNQSDLATSTQTYCTYTGSSTRESCWKLAALFSCFSSPACHQHRPRLGATPVWRSWPALRGVGVEWALQATSRNSVSCIL